MKKYIRSIALIILGTTILHSSLKAMLEEEGDSPRSTHSAGSGASENSGSLEDEGEPSSPYRILSIEETFDQLDSSDPNDALLLANRAKIEETILPYVGIQAAIATEELPLWASKFGGQPFLPSTIPYPTSINLNAPIIRGRGARAQQASRETPMHLIAQLNLSDLPPVIEEFPRSGLLQFYGSRESSDMDFRVIYIPEIDPSAPQHDLSSLPNPGEDFAVHGVFSLAFESSRMPVTTSDNRFEEYYKDILEEEASHHKVDSSSDEDKSSDGEDTPPRPIFSEAYLCSFCTDYSYWMGGYPTFTQNDCRPPEKDILLLHMGSSLYGRRQEVRWGMMDALTPSLVEKTYETWIFPRFTASGIADEK